MESDKNDVGLDQQAETFCVPKEKNSEYSFNQIAFKVKLKKVLAEQNVHYRIKLLKQQFG